MSKKIKGLVFTALDNAYEGGYEDVINAKPEDEAINLLDYDADIAEYRDRHKDFGVMDLVPLVEEWQRQKKEKRA